MSKPIDWSKPLQTRDGRKARLLGILSTKGSEFPYICAVGMEGDEVLEEYQADGSWGADEACKLDLINVPERIKREVWVNVYAPRPLRPSGAGQTHESKEAADANADTGRIACVKVVIECNEGEGL